MTFISYAQNFEDVLLWRALGNVDGGHYLDIGAQDPVIDSISLAFYTAGWRGTHVEATAEYAALLRKARPDEIVIQAAVTDRSGPVTFYEIPGTGLSTGEKEIAQTHMKAGFESRQVVVPSVRLDDLLAMENRDIHWMKIDVEGMEGSVLRSWGDSPVRPWVLVIEATYPSSQTPTDLNWISEVSRRGYKDVYFDGLSKFFVHEKHDALIKFFKSPPNVFDGFSLPKAHFAARTLSDQFNAEVQANSKTLEHETERYEAEKRQYEAEAQQKIEDANARAQSAKDTASAAFAETARLRSDLSAAVERIIGAQREHRETITRLWGDRQVSEATLRRESRQAIEKLEAELQRTLTSEETDKKGLTAAVSALDEELRAVRVQVSDISTRENALRRSNEQLSLDLARSAEEARRASAAFEAAGRELDVARARGERAIRERDEAIANVSWLRAQVDAATEERAAAQSSHKSILGEHFSEDPPIMNSNPLSCEQNPLTRADSLAQLVAWNDINFVRCAYVTVLGRPPDREGEALYTDMLRSGISKLRIIISLRNSPEGREHDPGIAGFDRLLRQYQRSTVRGIGWFFRNTPGARLETTSAQLQRLETTVVANSSQLHDTIVKVHQNAERARLESEASRATMTSFVAEFRAFREEQGARTTEQSLRSGEQAARNAEQTASFVAEFRAFRDEQAARITEQITSHRAETENVQAILASFVGEFRAFREENAGRSRGTLETVRGLKSSLANEFDALRSEQGMRASEFRDLINVAFDGRLPASAPASYEAQPLTDPAFGKLGPASARIVKQLKSIRTYTK